MAPSDPTQGSTTGTQTGRSGVETARDTARETARDLSHDASRLAERARETVRDGVAGARDEASRQANRGIDRTADEVSHTAHALETAAAEFGEGSLQHQLFHRAADGLSELSGALRGRSVGDMAADLAHFGRRNPAAFLGGAALVGFAIARFARASRHDQYGGDRPAGYGGAQGAYGGASGAGMAPRPQQSPTARAPYGSPGGPTTPVAGPAATGTTAGAGTASPSGARPVTGSSTGSTGGGSTASVAGASTGGAGQTPGSDPLNKGKPNV